MNKQIIYSLLAAALVIAVLLSGCTEQKPQTVNKTNAAITVVKIGDIVEANYTEDGKNYSVKFREGAKTYKFEENITGMKIGEIKNISLFESSNVEVSNEVSANAVYTTAQGEIKIFNVTDTSVYFGPKLAGETLYFNITLKNISFPESKKACISKYNLTPDTVIFYHSKSCGWCTKMMPWVEDLRKAGYKFLMAESGNSTAMNIIKDCMSDVHKIGGGVPQFGCPANLQLKLGAFASTDALKKFTDECIEAAKNLPDDKKGNATKTASKGSTATVSYYGKLKNGEVFDNRTISFKIGGGQMIKGFDDAVTGMKINENKFVEISPDNAYGYPSQVPKKQKMPADKFKSTYGEDAVLNKMYPASGQPWKIKVIKIETTTRNITIKILNITSGMEAFFKGKGIISLCANNVSLDKKKFYECYSSGVKKAVIDADIKFASSLGVSGTPIFYTGCNASTIEKICSSLSSSVMQTCKGRLKTNSKLQCEEGGKFVVYEFTDLQCPYCNNAEPLIKELNNNTAVKLNIKLFPLSFHKDSDKESFAAECARDQGRFEEFKSCEFTKFFSEGVRQVEE